MRKITGIGNETAPLTGDALRLWNRTEELKALPSGWDGASAMPLEKKAVTNVQKVLTKGLSADFRDWLLFPDDAGTLLLQSRDGFASISIGNNSFSYVYEKDGKIYSGDKVRFSPSSVLDVLREIAA